MEFRAGLPGDKLSWTVVSSYLRCPYCCYLEYVESEGRGAAPINFPIGSGVHGGFEAARIALKQGVSANPAKLVQIALPFALEAYEEALQAPGRAYTEDEAAEGYELVHWAVKGSVGAVAEEQDLWPGFRIQQVERWLDYGAMFPFKFSGKADLIMGNDIDGPGMVRDLKTASSTKKMDEWERMQMAVYALPFAKPGKSMCVGVDRITLTTQEPRLHRYDDTVTYDEIMSVYDRVLAVAEAMEAGRWPMAAKRQWTCLPEHPKS